MSASSIVERLRVLIVEAIDEIDDVDILTTAAKLRDLGIDSVSGLNLLLAMEEEFDVKFPEDMLTNEVFESPSSLAAALKSLGV